eukprot:12773992-Alexandrium_andersonii.AAC.1
MTWGASSRTSPCPGPIGTHGARARGAGAARPSAPGVMRAELTGRRRPGPPRPTGASAMMTGPTRRKKGRRNPPAALRMLTRASPRGPLRAGPGPRRRT